MKVNISESLLKSLTEDIKQRILIAVVGAISAENDKILADKTLRKELKIKRPSNKEMLDGRHLRLVADFLITGKWAGYGNPNKTKTLKRMAKIIDEKNIDHLNITGVENLQAIVNDGTIRRYLTVRAKNKIKAFIGYV